MSKQKFTLMVGASRGLGLAIVQELLESEWKEKILQTSKICRTSLFAVIYGTFHRIGGNGENENIL